MGTSEDLQTFQSAVKCLHEFSLPFPRYFFQSLQNTTIKLSITPQPKQSSDHVLVANSTNLAVKVEGIIQHRQIPNLYRKIEEITLSVSAHLQKPNIPKDGKIPDTNVNLSKSVKPHNDFFSAQFLLEFPVAGIHIVTIDTSVGDETGKSWHTGPKAQLSV